ncbi:uncharacterized protein LOC127463257 [Manacus candei]|uniref:uncharacterized protein LOC127463257 n=1 Tax=Manacus candei TaxID=415023 RepID=UPI0022267F21|nr:uncharacterized protein LOC127463257 [Manacus candei]
MVSAVYPAERFALICEYYPKIRKKNPKPFLSALKKRYRRKKCYRRKRPLVIESGLKTSAECRERRAQGRARNITGHIRGTGTAGTAGQLRTAGKLIRRIKINKGLPYFLGGGGGVVFGFLSSFLSPSHAKRRHGAAVAVLPKPRSRRSPVPAAPSRVSRRLHPGCPGASIPGVPAAPSRVSRRLHPGCPGASIPGVPSCPGEQVPPPAG